MDEVTARAMLVDPAAAEGASLAATVDRSQIEGVLRTSDAEPELLLDVTRSHPGADERGETRRVAVAWERSDLERVLTESGSDRVTFAIDPRSLMLAFDQADVEAHGLRERAAVLSVALLTAGGAGVASAHGAVMLDTGGGTSATLPASYTAMENARADLVSRGAEGAALGASYTGMENTRSELVARGSDSTDVAPLPDSYTAAEAARSDLVANDTAHAAAAPDSTPSEMADAVTSFAGTAGLAAPQELMNQLAAGDTLPDSYTAAEAARSDLVANDTAHAPAAPDSTLPDSYTAAETARPDLIARGSDTSDFATLPDAYTAAESARADLIGTADDTGSSTVSTGDGVSISAPSPEAFAAGGMIALAIAGAAFAARTRRREHEQPA